MKIQLSKRIDWENKQRGKLGGSGYRYAVVFQQLFDTKIVIETDPGRFEIWVGQSTATRGYKPERFTLNAGQQYTFSWSYK